MHSNRFRHNIAIVVITALWSLGGAAPGINGDERQEIVRLAELMRWKAGTTVADIGAGDGTYSFAAVEKIGPSGRVYATEIDPEKLKNLREQVAKRKLENVIVVEGTADDTKLPSNCCDTIFLRHVYHHLTQPNEFDRNLVRSLKPGAHLAIIDFPPTSNSGPVEGVPKNRGGHGIPEKVLIEELTAAGLQVEKTIEDWSTNDYCVIFVKRSP
ncbi:MAG TPA: class I SAM-dependent methyltransferase [Candidatus Dormibacteraeota bacterium]|jgi:ubiquinone/menaquinone biosynthesis C-methylase UbiE|nr:class I SAM-dependent methyltransferase [Candidatus Dormibacteraeota bacterium]